MINNGTSIDILYKENVSNVDPIWFSKKIEGKKETFSSIFGKSILYQMIPRYLYQNPINERHVCKNNYPLTHVFQLLVG